MQRFEYKVVPAPRRGEKARGVKATEDRFALALSQLMNEMAVEGWEFQRGESLPCDERSGLTGVKTTVLNMLVFRRALPDSALPGEPVLSRADPQSAAPSLQGAVEAGAPSGAAKPLRLGAAVSPEGSSPALGPAQVSRS